MGLWDFLRRRPPVVDVQDRGANAPSHVSSDVAAGANSRKPPATPRLSKPEPTPATDSVTKEEILKIQQAGDVVALAALLSHGQSEVREAAADALSSVADKRALPQLLKALEDPQSQLRMYAAAGLGIIGDPDALTALRIAKENPVADDEFGSVARVAQKAIDRIEAGSQDSTALGDILMRRWSAPSPGSDATAAAAMLFSRTPGGPYPDELIASAVRDLVEGGGAFGAEVLCNVSLLSHDGRVCRAAAQGLRGRTTPRIMEAYTQACHFSGTVNPLTGSDWTLPSHAANALAAIGDPSGLAAVDGLLNEILGQHPTSGMTTITADPFEIAARMESAEDVFVAACRSLGALSGQEVLPVLERFRSDAESQGKASVAKRLAEVIDGLGD